jgi:hypothetical protein
MNIYYSFDKFLQLPNEIQNHIIAFLPKHPIIDCFNKSCIHCNYKNCLYTQPNGELDEIYYCQHYFCDYCLVKKYVITNKKHCRLCNGNINFILDEYDEKSTFFNEPQ